MLQWAQNDSHNDFVSTQDQLKIYSPDGLIPSEDNWLTEFISVNLDENLLNAPYGCKTEALYYIGFEQMFDCLEYNCVSHCSWGIHFHEVLNEQRNTIQDLHTDGTLMLTYTNWIDQFMRSKFPSICFDYNSLLFNHQPIIHY